MEYTIPDGTRRQLHVPGHIGTEETLRHDRQGDHIDCGFREDLGDEVAPGTLEFDSTFLLNLLEERLVTIVCGPADAPDAALAEPFHRQLGLAFLTGEVAPAKPGEAHLPDLAESQQSAIRFALAQRVADLWGPTGKGKTQPVARLVRALLERTEMVLLTAHTNIATHHFAPRVLQLRKLPRDAVIPAGYHAASMDE